ncbi:Hypothetical predicted protein [Mytilus galloprovincialis]|uniref:PiggyBac transposable element-derived protein domain-containing protein n=2 Tax=Mytilus TaxID=6548 RepID=A0A8B6HGN7_MYTGA|nr:Hypothetical predicted protein [Mytilus galloprovincialis]VDI79912.1 Hypothetical predicted protein [Mytilus galloprovincialis]
MGLIKKATISEYWNRKHSSQSTPWFRKVFTRNRFQLLLKFLHLVDNRKIAPRNSPSYDPTAKFKPIVDHFNLKAKKHYSPSQNLSIDESLIGTKSRTVLRQYIPTKHAKFGVKLWMLTEAVTGYCFHFNVYKGKRYDPTPAGELQGSYVVISLLRAACLLNKWYHVFCDSFFTSLSLAKRLLNLHTYTTGTVRSNRPLPNLIKSVKLRASQSMFMRQQEILVCAFKEKEKRKNVKMLSTRYNAELVVNRKPKMITEYNKFMGGVDLNDMLTSFYEDGRKSTKMWKKIVFNIIHRMVINAYILYQQNSDNAKSRLHFIQLLIDDLSEDHMTRNRVNIGVLNDEINNQNLRKLPERKEKDCCICSVRNVPGGRKRSKHICVLCHKGVHKMCYKKHSRRCHADE